MANTSALASAPLPGPGQPDGRRVHWTGRRTLLLGGAWRPGRRLSEDDESADESADPVISVIIGTLTVMGGTRIQPVILLLNGFIAAHVGTAFGALTADFTAPNIIEVFLRLLSGFSIGTVGIQNMRFKSALQGGVLFASVFQLAREQVATWIEERTSGEARQWLLLAVDAAVTGAGSALALALKALFKVLNSAYLSATMFVFGWVTIIEQAGVDVPQWVETVCVAVVLLFCMWWHSLIVSNARQSEWKALTERPHRVHIKSTLQRLWGMLVGPIVTLNKLVSGFSQTLGRYFNLKAKPMTAQQIFEEVSNKLGISSLRMMFLKFTISRQNKSMVDQVLKEQGMEAKDRARAVQLTGMVCSSLDVESMKRLLFKMRTTGSFLEVLDDGFEDVAFAMQRKALASGGREVFDAADTALLWECARAALLEGVVQKARAAASESVLRYCGIEEAAQKDFVVGCIDNLDLQEMITISRMIKSGCFDLEDLVQLTEAKAKMAAAKAAARAKNLAAHKAHEARQAAGASASQVAVTLEPGGASDAALDAEAAARAAPQVHGDASHGAASPEPPAAAKEAALEASRLKAVEKLAESLSDVLKIQEAVEKVPLLGKLATALQERATRAADRAVSIVPVVGPRLRHLGSGLQRKLKAKILSHGMRLIIAQTGVPMADVAGVVRKFAAQDEYLDDALESLLLNMAGCGPAAPPGAAHPEPAKEVGGLAGLALRQLQERGPGACRECLLHIIVDLFQIDLLVAEKFVKQLNVKDLLVLGQGVQQGGFDFNACTKLVKNAVEEITFKVPVSALQDGQLGDAMMCFNFQAPPVVVDVDEDWAASVAGYTGSEVPAQGDRLAFVGSKSAAFMSKWEFEHEVKKIAGSADELKLKFQRGLNVDFAERFREVLPAVLRKELGVPFEQGRDLARNLTMTNMQRLVFILLTGGLKRLDDLASALGVEVNFEQAFKAHLPQALVLKYGFSYRGARKFCESLDPSTESFLTRMLQMVGMGDLEAMSAIICTDDIGHLDQLHRRRFRPRADLNRLLKDATAHECESVNIVVTEAGALRLWKDGAELGAIHRHTVDIVIAIWRELQDRHLDEEAVPIKGVELWSGEEAVNKLQEARADVEEVLLCKAFFKWPQMVVESAGLSEGDAKVAQKLFFVALEEARESVWDKYERKIGALANQALGPRKGTGFAETADADAAAARENLESYARAVAEIEGWIGGFFAAVAGQGGNRRNLLRKMEKAIEQRDTFRMQKLAAKVGVTDLVPTQELLAHLNAELSALPVDVTSQADQLSAYLTASKHPLTGKFAGSIPVAPAPAYAGEAAQPSVPKMKELFKLAQAGGFEQLSSFAASSAPGGMDSVARQMRKELATRLSSSFYGITPGQARAAVEALIPAGHAVLEATRVAAEAPGEGECVAARGERDGEELPQGALVAVAEERGGLARLAKPARGWLPLGELQRLEVEPGNEGRQTADVSLVMRAVMQYQLDTLTAMSDELGWGLDFTRLARERIVQVVTGRFSDYQAPVVRRAALHKSGEDLKACLLALDRRDVVFVVESLSLPPPQRRPKPQPKAKAKAKATPEAKPPLRT